MDKMTILAVDDNPQTRMIVEIALKAADFDVVLAENGREALDRHEALMLQKRRISLVITDYDMPVMDGAEFIRALRQRDASIPILMLTAQKKEPSLEEAKQVGANGWLGKPFNPESLRRVVREVLQLDAA